MLTPSIDRRISQINTEKKLYKGLDRVAHNSVGLYRRKPGTLATLMNAAHRACRISEKYRHLGDRHLRERMDVFRVEFARRDRPDMRIVLDALAVLREVAERKIGLYPYPVQLAGALALYRGHLAEMATGEGKTLTAGLAAVLLAWKNAPCHIITANDYLAERDAAWMGPLYKFCGLSAGHVVSEMDPVRRREGYGKRITYVTSKEVVADFLRDRLILGRLQEYSCRKVWSLHHPGWFERSGVVMRGLHTAIIDEADHLLIDEAVTPVIICKPHANDMLKSACREAADLAELLEPDVDFTVNRRYREVELKPVADRKIALFARTHPGLWKAERRGRELILQALEARYFYEADKNYVVQDGKIVIVDEFTGRLMPSRSWRAGMHQAVEAKDQLDLSDPTETTSSLSLQRFFRFYHRLSGMTGTAYEARDEFWQIYQLPFVSIPTNKRVNRKTLKTRYFAAENEKNDAIFEEIKRIHETGQPILVGIRSVRLSEGLSRRLDEAGLAHRVLNAVRHKEEAQIVAEAGHLGRITIATNMAGRGTDILLGDGVRELGGLYVILAEKYESKRVDRQFIGRCARQGDPGVAEIFASLEDDLMVKNLPPGLHEWLKKNAALLDQRALWSRIFDFAQWTSERKSAKQRKAVLRRDDWLEESLPYAALG